MLSIIEKNSPGRIEDLAGQTVVVPGLYVHIPFCFHKCHYCDFYSITAQTPERMERFVELILREARMWKDRVQAERGHAAAI